MKRVLLAGLVLATSSALAELQMPEDIRIAVEADLAVCNAYDDKSEAEKCVDEVVEYHSFHWEVRHRQEQAELKRQQEKRVQQEKQNMSSRWVLDKKVDQLTDKTIETLTLISDNSFRFRFPFNDENHLMLQIRKHPRFGEDIILHLLDGQFLCLSTRCKVSFRIDGGNVIEINGVRPSDGNNRIIFVSDSDRRRLWNPLISAEKILVSPTVHAGGNPIFEFTAKR